MQSERVRPIGEHFGDWTTKYLSHNVSCDNGRMKLLSTDQRLCIRATIDNKNTTDTPYIVIPFLTGANGSQLGLKKKGGVKLIANIELNSLQEQYRLNRLNVLLTRYNLFQKYVCVMYSEVEYRDSSACNSIYRLWEVRNMEECINMLQQPTIKIISLH